jgi:hypothetical protein
METPFDIFIVDLLQLMLKSSPRHSLQRENISLLFTFSKIARVLYINMVDTSEKLQAKGYSRIKPSGTKIFTSEEMREIEEEPIRCRLSYMEFIEHINRTGRVLKNKGFTPPPLYARIYFYRNNMIEHWDRYLEFISAGDSEQFIFQDGKIAIPYAFAGITRPAISSTLQQELTDEFAKKGVTLPSLVGKWYAEYSNIMYVALEKIDSQLRKHNKKQEIGIPEPIVNLLHKYSFPTPICDMEEYCKILVEWLKSLPLQ